MTLKKFFNYKGGARYSDSVLYVFIQELKTESGLAIVDKSYYPKHEILSYVNYKGKNETKINKLPRSYHILQQLPLEELCWMYRIDSNKDVDEINIELSKYYVCRDPDKYKIKKDEIRELLLNPSIKNNFANLEKNNCYENNIEKEQFKINLYNVGQACCSALTNGGNVHTIFDLGSTRYHDRYINALLHKKILKSEYNMVNIVISHYHNDHLNLIKYLKFKEDMNNKIRFILPYPLVNINSLCINSLFLLSIIAKNNCQRIFLSLEKDNVYQLGILNVYQGNGYGERRNSSTFINNKSLIVYVKFNKDSLLVPGDAIYDAWPRHFDVTHLIIPHHGCKYEEESSAFPNIDVNKVKKAVVYAGPDKRYGHPDISHISKYKNIYRFYNRKSKENRKVFDNGKRVRDCCIKIRKGKKSFSLH